MATTTHNPNLGAATVGNHVAVPRWTFVLRIFQVVLAIIILGLVAFSTSKIHVSGLEAAYGLNIFTVIMTFFGVGYIFASSFAVHNLYHPFGVLAIDLFLIIFWLISFSVLGNMSSNFVFVGYYYDYFYKRDVVRRSEPGYVPWETGAAAAGLGGLEFILFIITFIIFGYTFYRHRSATRGGAVPAGHHGGAPVVGGAAPIGGGVPVAHEAKYDSAPVQEAGNVSHEPQVSYNQAPPQEAGFQSAPVSGAAPTYAREGVADQGAPVQAGSGAPAAVHDPSKYSTAPEVHAPAYTGPGQ